MKHYVKVTEDDIALGTRHSARACPIALALAKEFNITSRRGLDGILVASKDITVIPHYGKYNMSRGVAKFVRDYDAGKKVAPFVLELDGEKDTARVSRRRA